MNATDPAGSLLTYEWSAKAGTFEGTGATVTWKTTNVRPGSYDIAGTATNGAGQAAHCVVSVMVTGAQAAPVAGDGHPSAKHPDNPFSIPQLPKLPAWSADYPVPAGLAIKDHVENLGSVFDRIVSTLSHAGISNGEWSAYAIGEDGFAIATRIEHIGDNGMPVQPRWNVNPGAGKGFPRTIGEFLHALLAADPGRYRVMLIVVTDRSLQSLKDPNLPATPESLKKLISGGEDRIPDKIRALEAGDSRRCVVLIYEFFRKSSSDQPEFVDPSALPGLDHVSGAGLWPKEVLR